MVDPPGEPLNKTIDGQPVHKKVFNITNYERNANQNHSELSPHTCQNGYCQKDKITSTDNDVEKRKPVYIYMMECYSVMRKKEILPFVTMQMNLKDIMQVKEVRQTDVL